MTSSTREKFSFEPWLLGPMVVITLFAFGAHPERESPQSIYREEIASTTKVFSQREPLTAVTDKTVKVVAPKPLTKKTPPPPPPPAQEAPPQPPPQTQATTTSWNTVNENSRLAVVNIFCTTKYSGPFSPISGSGVIIDSRGVILTNAHIGQYFLIKDYPVPDFIDCVIRTGSPATTKYRAKLLYISPRWIEANKANLSIDNPTGTGEFDFALLQIGEPVSESVTKPTSFSYLEPEVRMYEIHPFDNVLLVGYPAGFLGGISIQKDLSIVSTIAQIKELFTFTASTYDLFALGGSLVAQKGSSGGGVVNDKSKITGIIVTSTDAVTTMDRDLRAITLFHIDESLKIETGSGLSTLLSGDIQAKVEQFAPKALELKEILLTELNKE